MAAQDRVTPTNLDVIRDLAKNLSLELGSGLSAQKDSTEFQIIVLPKESAWYIEAAVREGLKTRGLILRDNPVLSARVEVFFRDARVEYRNITREGLFGTKTVERNIRLALDTKISRPHNDLENNIMQALSSAFQDTIEIAQVASLENPTMPLTKGMLPKESFLANLVEPLILIGSIAVAIFLLFNVRS